MWSDEMDKKIRDAAENDSQNYQEKDWKGMEGLLDKHLPQRKRRRGIIVFFLLAALSVSGYLLVSSVSSSRTPVAQQEEEVTVAEPGKPGNAEVTDNTKPASQEQITSNTSPTTGNDKTTSIQQRKDLTVPAVTSQNITTTPVNTIPGGKNDKLQDKISVATRNNQLNPNSSTSNPQRKLNTTSDPVAGDDLISSVSSKDKEINNIPAETENQQTIPSKDPVTAPSDKQETKQPATTVTESKEPIAEPIAAATEKTAKKEKSPKSFGSRFSLTASAGPDYSSVHFKYKGEVRLAYGIGVGYAINDRFTIRSGIYAGRKVYKADAKTYKIGNISPGYKVEDINADCYVIEVPVNLVYNFATSKNHSWFGSAGLSSYFMKKEDYLYNVTDSWGTRKTWSYEHRNENTHPFSVVTLSAGYQYNFNKRFSLLAEPYVKLPIGNGVGSGKVMLNNTGILFTAAWKPFGKK